MRITPIRRLHSLELRAFTDFSYINICIIYNIKVSLPKWPKWWIFSPIFPEHILTVLFENSGRSFDCFSRGEPLPERSSEFRSKLPD